MTARCSLETEPWWARATSGAAPSDWPDWAIISAGVRLLAVLGRPRTASARSAASSLSRAVSRSARRRELANTIVELCCSIRSRTRSSTWGHSEPGARAVLTFLAELGHVLDRDDDLEVPPLLGRRRDDLDGSGAAEEAGHLVDRTHRRRQADALGRLVEQLVEPLEGDGEVGAALGAGDGVHLVDDHRLDAAQRLARLGGQHQEQRLGRGDQDVGRGRLQPPPVLRRGVARPHADPDLRHLHAEPLGGLADADQRGPQVALDVDGERLEGRDVEDPAPLLLLRHGLGGQPVDRPQERRQRLARPGRRHHQCVPSGRDGVPRADLRGRRLREGSREPLLRRAAELVHPAILPDATDTPSRSICSRCQAAAATTAVTARARPVA